MRSKLIDSIRLGSAAVVLLVLIVVHQPGALGDFNESDECEDHRLNRGIAQDAIENRPTGLKLFSHNKKRKQHKNVVQSIEHRGANYSVELENSRSINRIFGGQYAEPGQYPFMVKIKGKVSDCNGVILDHHHILAPASCITSGCDRIYGSQPDDIKPIRELEVSIGDLDTTVADGESFIDMARAKIFPHPEYCRKPRALQPDIAIIRTPEQMRFETTWSKYGSVNYIRLPRKTAEYEPVERGIISGWGGDDDQVKVSPKLKSAFVEFYNAQECENYNNNKGLDGMICLQSIPPLPCGGDGGAPLFMDRNGEFELVGILSTLPDDCKERKGSSFFLQVSKYVGWINEYMYMA